MFRVIDIDDGERGEQARARKSRSPADRTRLAGDAVGAHGNGGREATPVPIWSSRIGMADASVMMCLASAGIYVL